MIGSNKLLALEYNFSQALLNFINAINPTSFAELQTKRKAEKIEASKEELEQFAWMGSVTIDGVAFIKVKGPILSDEDGWIYYYSANIVGIKLHIENALNDRKVFAIVLISDSPGGEITGVHELASFIYQARDKKPLIAYAAGDFCSAMYWIGAACHCIIADPTALLGSIGVVTQFVDRSQQLKQNGIKVWSMVSSQSPHKRVDPSKNPGKEMYQTMLDQTADVMLNDVALFRGTTPDAIIKAGNYGFVRVGKAALEHGLCDALGTLDELKGILSQTKDPQAIVKQLGAVSSTSHLLSTSFKPINGANTMEPLTAEQTEQLQKYAGMGLTLAEGLKLMDLEDLSEEATAAAEKLFKAIGEKDPAEGKTSGSSEQMKTMSDKMVNLAKDIGSQKDGMEKLSGEIQGSLKETKALLENHQTAMADQVKKLEGRVKSLEAGKIDEGEEDIDGSSSDSNEFEGAI